MPHVLARLKGVKIEDIKRLLHEHAPMHAKEGMYLENIWLWQNADDSNEILFIENSRVNTSCFSLNFQSRQLAYIGNLIQIIENQWFSEMLGNQRFPTFSSLQKSYFCNIGEGRNTASI